MESVLVKANLVILSTSQYWLIFNGEEGMSDCEGHGHMAIVYKSHFPPLRHSVVTETPADTLANKPRLTKDQALCSLRPHDRVHIGSIVLLFDLDIHFYLLFTAKAGPLMVEGLEDVNKSVYLARNIILYTKL